MADGGRADIAADTQIDALRNELGPALADAGPMLRSLGGERRCLERFVVATSGDIADAAERFKATVEWRAKHGLGDQPVIEEQLRALIEPQWPGGWGRLTPDGSVTIYLRYGELDPRAIMAAVTEEQLEAYYIYWMERSLAQQNEANAAVINGAAPGPWRGVVEVHDMSGLGVSQIHLPFLQMLSRVLSIGAKYYPENLRKMYVINAPYVFYGAYEILKKVMRPRTIAKITITAESSTQELLNYLGGEENLAALVATVPVKPVTTSSWSSYLGY
jgi:hypothetical protein